MERYCAEETRPLYVALGQLATRVISARVAQIERKASCATRLGPGAELRVERLWRSLPVPHVVPTVVKP